MVTVVLTDEQAQRLSEAHLTFSNIDDEFGGKYDELYSEYKLTKNNYERAKEVIEEQSKTIERQKAELIRLALLVDCLKDKKT